VALRVGVHTMDVLYTSVFVFLLVIVGFVLVSLAMSKFLQTQAPATTDKMTTYECGERPIGPAWFNFNPRFYVLAIIFVIFDVEVAFMFPVAVVYSDWVNAGNGGFAFVEIGVFVSLLILGLAYVWIKGDINWVKAVPKVETGTDRIETSTESPETPTIL